MSNSTFSLSPTQRFWRLLHPDRKEIYNVYVYSIFNGLIYLSLPLGIQAIINLIQGGQMNVAWIVLVFLVVLGIAATGVLQIFQMRITENLQQKIFARAAFEFAYRIPRMRMEVLYKHYAPELMNRFFDTMSVQKGLSKILIDFSTAGLQVLFGIMLLSLYHPFFIVFGVLLVLLLLSIIWFTVRRGLRTSLKESKYKYQVAHWLEELARTHATFKLAGRTDLPLHRTDGHVGDYLAARESHFEVLIRQYSFMVIFKVLVAAGLLAIGGILVMEQRMNIGQFVAAEIIILQIMSSAEKLVSSLETIYDVLTGLEKIGQVTDLELENTDGVNLEDQCPNLGLNVELKNVNFEYPDHQKRILHNLSLEVPCSQRLVIAGPNGSGKSTLLHIMAGLYDIQDGHISYNGFPKGSLDLSSLHTVIGDALSQVPLFQGTILENIAMGRPGATFENVQWAVRNLNLEGFIKELPMGYQSVIDPQGTKLPQSTVQKLLIARAIVDKPKLLILEDAFMPLDMAYRKDIIDFISDPSNGWTLVAVSGDPYLAQRVDQIAYMQDGRIVKIGNYEEMKDLLNSKSAGNA